MTFDLNINVQIGVTPQLNTLLTAFLQKIPNRPKGFAETVTVAATARLAPDPEPETPAASEPVEEQTAEVPAESEKPRRTHRATAQPTAEPEAPAAPEPVEEQTAESTVQQPEKPLTEEDIRACMHRTRQRFEGENYKENTDSEAYKKYHKQLTSQFKGIAVVLGADKPSALPLEQRAAFIAECDALIIDADGNISTPTPPF